MVIKFNQFKNVLNKYNIYFDNILQQYIVPNQIFGDKRFDVNQWNSYIREEAVSLEQAEQATLKHGAIFLVKLLYSMDA